MQKYSSQVKQLSHQQLLSQTKLLVQKERNIHIQILHHLEEIDSRKLYLELGFSSLFDYAVKELEYSEGAAYRRIKAMKLCRDLPDTENRLQSGKLSLSSASQLQAFFEKQAKKIKAEKTKKEIQETNAKGFKTEDKKTDETSKVAQDNFTISQQGLSAKGQKEDESHLFLSIERKQELVKKAEGCSTRATIKLLSEADPCLSVSKEQTRFLGSGKVEIKLVIDENCHKKLEELKSLLSHKNPILSHGELLSILLEEALEKYDPRRKKVRKTCSMRKEPVTSAPKWNYPGKAKKLSRAISSKLKRHVWQRDEGQCAYVHSETKRRCSSRHLLQIDHIRPFALGGKSEASNLRLLCASHNQYRSEKTFGRKISYTSPV